MQLVEGSGKIVFDPKNMTKKHDAQGSWKRSAMLIFGCDMADYYAWFIMRRYSIVLQTPIRGAHVTFVNDRANDMKGGAWEEVKSEWDGLDVKVQFDTDVRTDGHYWWMRVEPNLTFQKIRRSLGLGDPYFPYHLTIGYPNNKNEHQSHYIHGLLKKGLTR